LLNLPIEGRRKLLENLLTAPEDPLRLSPLLQASAGQILEAVRKPGLEGVVGKRIDSIYVCSRGSVFRSYSRSYPPSISTMYLKRPSVTPIW
jgi:ATP-dependent DNA ligase